MGIVMKKDQKVFIENIGKVSWDTGEMCEFASSLVSALRSLGEEISYSYVMGTSGVPFRFTLNPGQWDFTNYSIRNISSDMDEPIRRAFAAAGYAYELCLPGSFQDDSEQIMSSINRGIPVLAFRVVGPSDCCVISGHDEDGKVLLGWSTFQDIPDDHNIPHDVTGYFRKPDWHDNIHGYILIGVKVGRPPLRDVYMDAFKWAVNLMGIPQMSQKVTGLNALQGWADEMTQEEYFPEGDEEILGQRYVSAAINMTMLRDHCVALPFLHQAMVDVPDFKPEIAGAADCYSGVVQLRDQMDDLISDNFSQRAMKAIRNAQIRREYANLILKIKDKEKEALQHFEKLIDRFG